MSARLLPLSQPDLSFGKMHLSLHQAIKQEHRIALSLWYLWYSGNSLIKLVCSYDASLSNNAISYTQNGLSGLNFIIHNTEVCTSIAIVYGNWMAAECRLLRFIIIILTISPFCIAFLLVLVMRWVCLNFRNITETNFCMFLSFWATTTNCL